MVRRSCWLLIIIKLTCLATGGGLATIFGVAGIIKLTYPQDYPDPFLPYEIMIFRRYVDDELCAAEWQDKFTHQSICKIEPTGGVFDEINILRCDCDPPTFEIAFWSRRLQVADLVRRWGRPDQLMITYNGNQYLLLWDAERVEAYTLTASRFTYFTFVQLVRWHN